MHLEFHPEQIIELNKELATGYHPRLAKELAAIPGDANFIERFATIAAYCEVALDGMYTSDQMVAMVGEFFIPRLQRKRENPNKLIIVKDL